MSYQLKTTQTGEYNIFEKKSKTLITLETTKEKAQDFCRKLNLGSGFNGWTPLFFANVKGLSVD